MGKKKRFAAFAELRLFRRRLEPAAVVLCNRQTMLRPHCLALALAVLLITGFWSQLHAQVPGLSLPESSASAEAQNEQSDQAQDDSETVGQIISIVAPDSPQAAVRGFLEAADAGRWGDATRFLSLSDGERARGPELAERLKGVIDSHRVIDPETISGNPEGRTDDNLPVGRDQVAVVPIDGRNEPMRMVRVSTETGPEWHFSTATVSRIDAWYESLPDRGLREFFHDNGLDFMLRAGPFEIRWWQWIALPVLLLVSWGIGRLIRAVASPIVGRLAARTSTTWDDRLLESIGPPLTLAFALLVFAMGAVALQLNRSGFEHTGALLRAGFAFTLFWGLWRSTGVIVAFMMGRPWAAANPSALHLLTIGANVLRGLFAGLGLISIIAALGYPVGTVLAGLGIGGLALAFGAQKTVENIFGSIALAIDQPIRVGDFVRVQDFVGTVEDVGLRSTRFRTLDRTIVSIPNGQLADQRLESFQVRDRMRLATTIGVTYDTTQAQMQQILEGFERVLRAHPKIWPDAMVVRFGAFGASSLDIEIMAWFEVPTWADFQLCRQQVLLEFMGVVEAAGSSFAFPTQTVHLVQEGSTPP